jgi:hypothetical protein
MRSVIFGLGLVAAIAVGCAGDENDCDCAEVGCFADMCTKTVFVTAEPVAAKFGGVAAADQLCAQQAAAAMLPGTYYAWLSDGSQSPYDRFSKSTVPYMLPDGVQVANDFVALRSEPPPPIDVTAAGQKVMAVDDAAVWTGTGVDGRADTFNNASNYCSGWSRSVIEDFTLIGLLRERVKPEDWTRAKLVPCTGDGYLYCFQQ